MKKVPSPASRATKPRKPRKPRKPVLADQDQSTEPEAAVSFPIIGIGASAGGFEALEQFLAHVPENCGMAFVVVQHLDPTRKGLMPELLQRGTRMKVTQVKDRTRVLPNRVDVIPPNKNMSIHHGLLHLFEPSAKRGKRLPIDFFLSSLALDQQQKAIGVILSGMASDGTQGLREIKDKGGLAVVQEPSSAKFDSMPRSAIDAGLADIVAPAEELPARISAYLKTAQLPVTHGSPIEAGMRGAVEKILILMRGRTGHDFTYYKKNTLHRRIERRMGIHQIEKIASYVRFLNENPEELDLLFKVRRFTNQAAKITKLIPGDVGRPISDIACDLFYAGLCDDAREVLRMLGFMEKPIRTGEGRWFSARIMPYRTQDDRIDGVVISFWDISVAKELEAKLQEMQVALENRLAGKSTELTKAKTELKAERKRTTAVKPRKT